MAAPPTAPPRRLSNRLQCGSDDRVVSPFGSLAWGFAVVAPFVVGPVRQRCQTNRDRTLVLCCFVLVRELYSFFTESRHIVHGAGTWVTDVAGTWVTLFFGMIDPRKEADHAL